MNKTMIMTGVTLGAMTLSAITIQNEPKAVVVQDGKGTVVVNTAAPKYSLNEAIDLCIGQLVARGEKVTTGAVKNHLQRMPKSDVDLDVSGLSRTIREAVEAYEAKNAKDTPAPDAAKYDKREKFVADYADWKWQGLAPAKRKELHGRMGAESKYRREAKAEAEKLWKEAHELK